MIAGLGFSIGTVNTVSAVLAVSRRRPMVRTRPTVSVYATGVGGLRLPDSAGTVFADLSRDPAPVTVDGRAQSPANLVAGVAHRLLTTAGPAAGAVLTHPAVYSRDHLARLRHALDLSGHRDVVLVPEPVAAAEWLEVERGPLDTGFVLVYDLGATSLDLAVVRVGPDWSDHPIIGKPLRTRAFGGRPLGAALARHAAATPGELASDIGARTVEDLRIAHIRDTFDAVRACVRGGGRSLADIGHILVVGGAARPAEVARTLAELGRPVVMSADPGQCCAAGAAHFAARTSLPPQHPVRAPRVAVFSSAAVASALVLSAVTVFGTTDPGVPHRRVVTGARADTAPVEQPAARSENAERALTWVATSTPALAGRRADGTGAPRVVALGPSVTEVARSPERHPRRIRPGHDTDSGRGASDAVAPLPYTVALPVTTVRTPVSATIPPPPAPAWPLGRLFGLIAPDGESLVPTVAGANESPRTAPVVAISRPGMPAAATTGASAAPGPNSVIGVLLRDALVGSTAGTAPHGSAGTRIVAGVVLRDVVPRELGLPHRLEESNGAGARPVPPPEPARTAPAENPDASPASRPAPTNPAERRQDSSSVAVVGSGAPSTAVGDEPPGTAADGATRRQDGTVLTLPGGDGPATPPGGDGTARPGGDGAAARPDGAVTRPSGDGGVARPEGAVTRPGGDGAAARPEGAVTRPSADGAVAGPEGVVTRPGGDGGVARPGGDGVAARPSGDDSPVSRPGGVVTRPSGDGVATRPGGGGAAGSDRSRSGNGPAEGAAGDNGGPRPGTGRPRIGGATADGSSGTSNSGTDTAGGGRRPGQGGDTSSGGRDRGRSDDGKGRGGRGGRGDAGKGRGGGAG